MGCTTSKTTSVEASNARNLVAGDSPLRLQQQKLHQQRPQERHAVAAIMNQKPGECNAEEDTTHSHTQESTAPDEHNIDSVRNSTTTNTSHVTASSGEEVSSFSSVMAVSSFSSEFISSIKSEKVNNQGGGEGSSGEKGFINEKNSVLQNGDVGGDINISVSCNPSPRQPSLDASSSLTTQPKLFNNNNIVDENTTTKNTNNSNIDPYWEYLFNILSPNILDPQDMHSALDATISKMINNLSPVEVSFIRRRVKVAYRSIHHNSEGGVGGGNNGESVVGGNNSGNRGNLNSLANDSGGGGQSRFSLTKTVGRLVGYSSSPSSSDADGSHQYRRNQHLPHPALDESFDRTLLSKTIYQKDRLIDITMMRKIFEGGDRCLRKMRVDARKSMTSTVNLHNKNGDVGVSGRATSGGSYHGSKLSSSTTTNNEQYRRRSFPASSRWQQQHLSVDGKAISDIATVITSIDEDCTQPSDVEAIEKIDVYGSAYLLLLYMSEVRWDYIADIAKLSATAAGLTVDVNNLVTVEEERQQVKDRSTPAPPRPPSFTPLSEVFDSPNLRTDEPCGVNLSSICFLISLALRGTRRQKLNLLFFLLLPPRELNLILASHPAGGLPTWLLEVDEKVVFSFNSLSFYYYYDDVMLPAIMERGHSIPTERISLCIDVKTSVEILATLVAESLEEKPTHDRYAAFGVRRLFDLLEINAKQEDEITLSTMKCQKVKEALLQASLNGGSNSSYAVNLNRSEKQYIDNFVHCCTMCTNNSSISNVGDDRQVWSMNDFATWADVSINDKVLDTIMCHLFGTGILPTAQMECQLVAQRWIDWNLRQKDKGVKPISENGGGPPTPSRVSLRRMFTNNDSDHSSDEVTEVVSDLNYVWGGIGGADGMGGLGHGVLYCIDKKWWDEWVDYAGWKQLLLVHSKNSSISRSVKRPREISTEQLIDRSLDSPHLSGSGGSYELLKHFLVYGKDYVLVPPGVWNVLYEMYGGGPPLPRMVLPNNENNESQMSEDVSCNVVSIHDESVEIIPPDSHVSMDTKQRYPKEVPVSVRVATHPWVLHCLLCDPHQPYRRGDTGTMSIRVMAMPDQPLWRLFAEIVVRLPIHHAKARDSHGEGRCRLWKFDSKTCLAGNRYGPWALLCKDRFAEFPVTTSSYEKYEGRWETFAGQNSVATAGLSDGMRVLVEFAVVNKDSSFSWPREAAAKATTAQIISSEDEAFRNLIRGLDPNGEPLKTPIIRQAVDAMDSTGRWYEAIIVDVGNNSNPEISSVNRSGMDNASNGSTDQFKENSKIRVYFFDHAGDQEEWIDVNSDRLAVRGRMTANNIRSDSESNNNDLNSSSETKLETKSRLSTGNRKKDTDVADSISNPICLFPSYGSCGLINLGNTCYANSGWQCMSYLPLLRSYLLSGQYMINGDINRDNPLGTGGKILEDFSELLRLMWSGKYGARAPQKFRASLAKCRSQYCGTDQQDAQELINDMFDMLHEDGNRVRKKPVVDALEDGFIEKAQLSRLGQEAWRRFLRRNRSIISDLSMGQVYNRVTCPECNHSSRNFDPFSILSLPFPTFAEVIFQCTIIRRASALNCPNTLLHVGKQRDKRKKQVATSANRSPPSTELISEEYCIPMSRLADIGDLKKKIQHFSGIHVNDLRLYNKEDVALNAQNGGKSSVDVYTKISALPEKQGPCLKFLQHSSRDNLSPKTAKIIAFESTLRVRPIDLQNCAELTDDASTTASEISTESSSPAHINNCTKNEDDTKVRSYLKAYCDENECVVYDTNPTPLAKAISRNLWPKSTKDFTLGLRVDALDQRNQWCSGSVIEIFEEGKENVNTDGEAESVTKVKIHFDNYASKWDETFTIESFTEGRVCPLYSRATPRPKPSEFIVHHRLSDHTRNESLLFGQSFSIQFHHEWSTARAGAHILAQASRFLEVPHSNNSETGNILDAVDMKIAEKDRDEARGVISRAIDVLIKSDRLFVKSAIHHRKETDVTTWSHKLRKELKEILPRLPFEIRLTAANSPLEAKEEEEIFPFSLVRAVGNCMNARQALVLHWLDRPDSRKKTKQVLYMSPHLAVCLRSRELSGAPQTESNPVANRRPSSVNKGLHIGACLTEFCKEQQLDATGCWRCPKCKVEREGTQSMTLWNLPDLLTFHLKRFNASSRWREKITTKINFPLTGLNMREWCDAESPLCESTDNDAFIYDLVGVVNHFGGMTGGHYVATCRATACSPDGDEEVAYNFNGADIAMLDRSEEETAPSSGWRLGRIKEKESASNALSRAVAASAEPLWLQFDDDVVEPAPPINVESETAYVLFYKRRRMHPANIAKYSSI